MTSQELDVMERLWNRGATASMIAERLGYSVSAVLVTAMRNRDRFPLRRGRSTNRETRELWVSRIESGEVTLEQVAETLGLRPVTVYRWVNGSRKQSHLSRQRDVNGN